MLVLFVYNINQFALADLCMQTKSNNRMKFFPLLPKVECKSL